MIAPAQWPLKQDAFAQIAWSISANQPAYKPPPLIQTIAVEGSALSLLQQLAQVPVATEETKPAPTQTAVAPDDKGGTRSFDMLASFYSVPTPIAVTNFLNEHKQLPKLLFSAFPRIKSAWGIQAKPELDVVNDPEGGVSIMTVRLNSELPNAYQALDRFDEEWWLDHIAEAEGLLNFTLRVK